MSDAVWPLMGVDMHGVIECRPTFGLPTPHIPIPQSLRPKWQYAVDVSQLYSNNRNYDGFGCLFGVKSHAGFEPVAAERGMPADAAELTRKQPEGWPSPVFSFSWIGWDEIEAIDWDGRLSGAAPVNAVQRHNAEVSPAVCICRRLSPCIRYEAAGTW